MITCSNVATFTFLIKYYFLTKNTAVNNPKDMPGRSSSGDKKREILILTENEKRVIDELKIGKKNMDTLALNLNLNISALSEILINLQLKELADERQGTWSLK